MSQAGQVRVGTGTQANPVRVALHIRQGEHEGVADLIKPPHDRWARSAMVRNVKATAFRIPCWTSLCVKSLEQYDVRWTYSPGESSLAKALNSTRRVIPELETPSTLGQPGKSWSPSMIARGMAAPDANAAGPALNASRMSSNIWRDWNARLM